MPSLAPPLSIGPITLDAPIVQAALSGYSDRAMRVLARRHGAAYTIGEVLLDKFVVEAGASRRNRNRISVDPEEHPVGGQLMGADPEQFPPAALKLVEAGFDVIDINFGCPVKKVLGKCRGGFLLGVPETALEIVSRVRDAVPDEVPVTLKMRRGIDESAESAEKFWQIFEGAFAAGVAAITVHGRSVRQRYEGPSSWAFLREVKQAAGDRTVIGSGDLFSAAACVAMLEETGVDGVSIARGAIGNPWIFEGVRRLLAGEPLPAPPNLFAQADMLREHYALAEDLHGEELTCRVMRKFAIKYARLHPQHLTVRDAFVQVKQRADWMAVLGQYYAEDLPGRVPDDDIDETVNCF